MHRSLQVNEEIITEIIVHLLPASPKKSILKSIKAVLSKGAFQFTLK
jgi:hypothetical protein